VYGGADDYVSKTDVVLRARRAAAYADHETTPKIRESANHVADNACSLGDSILPKWQSRDHDLMTSYSPSGIHIAVLCGGMGRFYSRAFVFFVEKEAERDSFDRKSAYTPDGVVLNTRHSGAFPTAAYKAEEVATLKAV
jgi:hypothetical protein